MRSRMVYWDEEHRTPHHAPPEDGCTSLTPSPSVQFDMLGTIGTALLSLPLVYDVDTLVEAFSGVTIFAGVDRLDVINTEVTRATEIGRALLLLSLTRCTSSVAQQARWVFRARPPAPPLAPGDVTFAEVRGRRVAQMSTAGGNALPLSAFETMFRTSQSLGTTTIARLVDVAHRSFLLGDRSPVFKQNTLFRAMNQHLKTGEAQSRLFHRVPGTREVDTWVRVGDMDAARARHRLAQLVLLDLPFNPSGRGWSKPGEQRALLHHAGVSFEATARHSWTASLGVRSTEPGGYDELWPSMFSVARRNDRFCVVALRDLAPGMPVGVMLGVLRYHCDYVDKLKRIGEPRGTILPVNRFLWLAPTDDDGLPLESTVDAGGVRTRNPMAFVPRSTSVAKASNLVMIKLSVDVYLYTVGPRAVRRGRELCVRI